MSTERVTFPVTREHIEQGQGRPLRALRSEGCPVALALHDAFGGHWSVIHENGMSEYRYLDFSPETRGYIEALDRNQKIEPFTGEGVWRG